MSIEDELLREFECQSIASAFRPMTASERREERRRKDKRERILKIQDQFADVWESGNRPKTREEAVAMLTPMAGYVLSLLFNMLSRRVIEWLWDRYTAAEGRGEFASVTVSAENVA